jgi:hypothetical protein
MAAKKEIAKVECLNPNTGRKMFIDAAAYDLFGKAIRHCINKSKAVTFTEMVDGVKKIFKEQKTPFKGSIGWYTVTVKNDMEANGLIVTTMEKGKKIHRLKK